jgi:hypothetical protein
MMDTFRISTWPDGGGVRKLVKLLNNMADIYYFIGK